MTTPANVRIEYGRSARPAVSQVPWRTLLVIAAIVALPIAAVCVPHVYTRMKWEQLHGELQQTGINRKRIDRQLYAFRNYSSPYQGLGPGQICIRYELMRMGTWAAIQVIYEADGTAYDVQPIFND